MNITLIGYGGMGQAVGRAARQRGHAVTAIDPVHPEAHHKEPTQSALADADIVIDFATADGLTDRIKTCIDAGKNLVVGTTGWYDRLGEVRAMIESSTIGFLWSSNFSIGVNMYFKIVEAAAKLINGHDEYDVWGHEIHHRGKADSPSGTAKTLSKILLKHIDRKTAVIEDRLDRKIEPHEFHFSSTRGGEVNFAHTIGFDSAADTITLTHSARNRDGYALGAVKAAEWLHGKKGFYEMNDFLEQTQ